MSLSLEADPLKRFLIRLFDGLQEEVLIDFQALFALLAEDQFGSGYPRGLSLGPVGSRSLSGWEPFLWPGNVMRDRNAFLRR